MSKSNEGNIHIFEYMSIGDNYGSFIGNDYKQIINKYSYDPIGPQIPLT